MPFPPEAAGALIADLTRRLEDLQRKTFTGRDKDSLVEATVDGEGLVAGIVFSRSISRHRPADVGAAIVNAVNDAQSALASAYASLAADAELWENET